MAIFNCEKTQGPLSRVVLAGLKNSHIGKVETQEAIKETAMQEIPNLEKRLGVLATIANITPLLGLLGTVTGMIRAFSVIQAKGVGHAGELAGGISQALITTAAGLTIAIPTLVAYNYLSTKVDERIHEIEKSSQQTLNLLFHKRDDQAVTIEQGE
jgi:biopolymer transport protein ExbB